MGAALTAAAPYAGLVSALPIDGNPNLSGPAHEAQGGQVVYLTEHGTPIAEVMPAGSAKRLQDAEDEANIRRILAGPRTGRRFDNAEEMLDALENVP